MSSENQQFSRQDLLADLEKGWKHYLSRLQELSEEEQACYAQEQGFRLACFSRGSPRILGGFEELCPQTPGFCASGHQSVISLAKMLDFNLKYSGQVGK